MDRTRRIVPVVLVPVLVALRVLLFPPAAFAQSSIGFKNPGDISALLAYRLPNWGYHTSSLAFSLDARDYNTGYDGYAGPPHSESSTAVANETVRLTRYRENEKRTSLVTVEQFGAWNWAQDDNGIAQTRNSGFRGGLALDGTLRRYLRGDAYVVGNGDLTGSYAETRDLLNQPNVDLVYRLRTDRTFSYSIKVGAGLGRVRDVTPLLQAARISERLRALDRPPLSSAQVEQVAEVLARTGGYGNVFDRPTRWLWRDALEPILQGEAPLSPFEALYLRDATFERLGSRTQGALIEGGIQFRRRGSTLSTPRGFAGPWVNASWSRNYTLDHQLRADVNSEYTRYTKNYFSPSAKESSETGLMNVSVGDLWVVADRVNWLNSVLAHFTYDFLFERYDRGQEVAVNSRLVFYVEDRLTVEPNFGFDWQHKSLDSGDRTRDSDSRDWHVSVGLVYWPGRGLY